ncbi:hypothetical protein GCM10007887_34870 [Methylobacterium haplocladii]|uniref:Uncharacterized protein n=1 Tax=Methylobacterium haplocladii TaxID=1176176 RepID=A0A512ITA7_9HYPH|nr:hypothetical protein MHA02_32660 [Methylobacterium haplocladii]GLS60799.1 hypothetical protein GCM10007887_34870 [Methylobacterium haplocladii]
MPMAKASGGFSPTENHSINSAREVSGVVSDVSRAMRWLPGTERSDETDAVRGPQRAAVRARNRPE